MSLGTVIKGVLGDNNILPLVSHM